MTQILPIDWSNGIIKKFYKRTYRATHLEGRPRGSYDPNGLGGP